MVIKKLNSIFHKHSRVLLLVLAVLVIIPFVIGDFTSGGGCSDPANTDVGVAFGEKVTVGDLRQFAQQLMLFNPNQNDDWQQVFTAYCYAKRAEQMGIIVTDDEVAAEINKMFRTEGVFSKEIYDKFLKDNALPEEYLKMMIRSQLGEKNSGREITDKEVEEEIKKKSLFHTKGAFSAENYNKFLKDRNIREKDFIESLRLNLLLRKLQETLTSGVVVTDAEAESFYRMANPGFELSICVFNLDRFKVDEPSEEAVKARFDELKKINPDLTLSEEIKKNLKESLKNEAQRKLARKMAEAEAAKLAKLKGDAKKKAFAALKFTHKKMTVPAAQAELEKMTSDPVAMQIYQHFNSNLPGILGALPQMEKMMGTLEIMPQMQQYMFYSQYNSMVNLINNLFIAGVPEVLALNAGEISPVLDLQDSVVLVLVDKRLDADMKDFAKCKDTLIKQLRNAKSQMTMQEFHENVMRQCSYTLVADAPAENAAETPAE